MDLDVDLVCVWFLGLMGSLLGNLNAKVSRMECLSPAAIAGAALLRRGCGISMWALIRYKCWFHLMFNRARANIYNPIATQSSVQRQCLIPSSAFWKSVGSQARREVPCLLFHFTKDAES